MVQPTGATLYFDDIEEFGEWWILLSDRARKDLQSFRRADGAMFQIVLEKIKWDLTLRCNQPLLIPPRQLSQGHFSRSNQKSLTGAKTKLPIYEARMAGDNRLIVCNGLFAVQCTSLIVLFSIR